MGEGNSASEVCVALRLKVFGRAWRPRPVRRWGRQTYWRAFPRDANGAAAVEFALIGPLFAFLLCGIVSYGGYFWISHAVQQMANDAARVALAGFTLAEREMLAQAVLIEDITHYGHLDPAKAESRVVGGENTVRVEVTYDASDSVFWAISKLVPMPHPSVSRSATVRLGGY